MYDTVSFSDTSVEYVTVFEYSSVSELVEEKPCEEVSLPVFMYDLPYPVFSDTFLVTVWSNDFVLLTVELPLEPLSVFHPPS